MRRSKLAILSITATGLIALTPAHVAAQSEPAQTDANSANVPVKFITRTDLSNAVSLIRPKVVFEDKGDHFLLVLPNTIRASGKLQNCEDPKTLKNCRTVSFIVTLLGPENKSREELLALVNQLNRTDIHGRTFLNQKNQVISRFTFFGTGNETLRSLAVNLINWDDAVRRNFLALNDISKNENR